MKKILVTGGAGYIGSHTIVSLMERDYQVIVVDNFSNSAPECINRVEAITGKKVPMYEADIRDKEILEQIFSENEIEAVIHFAGLKAVGESVAKPLEYYNNNVYGTLVLLDVMREHKVKKIIFSSSATVYGVPERLPLDEECRLNVTNPYGATKLMIENILRDLYQADPDWNIVLLRYFNPVGAHESGLIGEDPNGIPNNLMPFIAQVAIGKLDKVKVFGNDYDTPDGTGVRDYIHVVDLAEGHVKALEKMHKGVDVYNLGTGRGYSVLEMIQAFSKACNKSLPYEIVSRRPGDIAACYASSKKAEQELGWKARLGIEEMCASQWKWQSMNPNGYRK
ncbi:MAG: UDP-glucose 4-epimerase GalE [Acholeplasmataceae bacterium]|jgi:UDP-glucose 4-epimerase|nr:UDP-glucose 4-epimerase GalE [Acholeplasmataceae bacterium]